MRGCLLEISAWCGCYSEVDLDVVSEGSCLSLLDELSSFHLSMSDNKVRTVVLD